MRWKLSRVKIKTKKKSTQSQHTNRIWRFDLNLSQKYAQIKRSSTNPRKIRIRKSHHHHRSSPPKKYWPRDISSSIQVILRASKVSTYLKIWAWFPCMIHTLFLNLLKRNSWHLQCIFPICLMERIWQNSKRCLRRREQTKKSRLTIFQLAMRLWRKLWTAIGRGKTAQTFVPRKYPTNTHRQLLPINRHRRITCCLRRSLRKR